MKKITKYAFLILLGMILMWNHPIQSVKAQGEDDRTKEYDENLDVYILKNGDVVYHWDITDQGMFVDFPVSLPAPNSTTSAIEDASVELYVYQASPKPQDMGIYASGYGGYFEWDLPENEREYSFSHLSLEFDIDFDSSQNLSLGKTWLDSMVSQLETTLNVDFLQYSNATPGSRWLPEYRAFPQDYDAIWDLVLDPFPCGNTTLLAKEKILESDNKAIRIDAEWDDDFDDGDEEEYRWEYTTDLELYREDLVNIGKESENTIHFNELLGYEENFQMPTWVNESYLNIYLYKGAEISSVTPAPSDDMQDRGHIERELNSDGNMNGYLPDDANFVFTDAQESQPILNSLFTVNDTTINNGETITVTAIITNVGGQTAYDIDVYYPDFTGNDYNLTSDDFIDNIESLAIGESYETSATFLCDHSDNDIQEFQFYYYYDATSNLDLANHWSRPQFTGDRFYGSSNQIRLFENDVDPEPWMVVEYNIDNIGPQVGEEINITAMITNIGDVYASNIQWNFNPFSIGGIYNELGLNLTDESGIIERLNASESVNVSASYTVDAYNRYFGGECGYSCDLTFFNQNETSEIDIITNYYGNTEAGYSVYIIYPRERQIFGPVLLFEQIISAPSNEVGTVVTIDFKISNNGTTPAYNVRVNTEFYDSPEYFYIRDIEGIGPDLSIGTLYPGESMNYRTRFTLLKNTSIGNLSISPYVTYSVRPDSQTCYLTQNQISEGSKKLSGQTIWMIVAIAAIVVIIGESFVFYKKVKM